MRGSCFETFQISDSTGPGQITDTSTFEESTSLLNALKYPCYETGQSKRHNKKNIILTRANLEAQ
jgi:hypothetical protein